MIDLHDVSKVYQIGEERVHALDHVTLHIYPKEFVSVIGPSGSGKSTLMNIIGCLDAADAGTYRLDGIPIEDYGEKQLARVRNEKIGFIFQNFNLIAKLSAEENVELPLIYRGVRPADRQQRVAIARALVTEPSLLLADEPTGNLDSKTSREIMDILHGLHEQGNTVVLITHDNDIARQAKRSIHILDGRVTEVQL